MKQWLLVAGFCLLPALPAAAADSDPKLVFMSLCLRDATVAAGRREHLCECVRDNFAYGDNGFDLSDAIALDPRFWEAPEKRMPQDDIGNQVRRARKECLAAPASVSR